ncbi:MAG: aminotransferase class IV [Flavobacteriales bacterium]|nr:aminotransferase class IV [Flavobacteriales bacterium]
MGNINYNGNLLAEDQPIFDINNRGFRYGDALFETIRVINGEPCFFQNHFERLREGMQLLEMNLNLSAAQLLDEVYKLIQSNNIGEGARLRITVVRNSGGYYTPKTNLSSFVIEATELPNNQFELNENGLTIDLYEKHRKTINELSTLKSTNCLTYILAGQYKVAKGFDDCVLLNELGSIAECISSNIFIGYNGVLYTPSINQGIVPGIMRQQVIELCKEIGMEVQECPLSPQVLHRADEVFLTNAISGLKWVGAYRTKRYFSKVSKQLTDKLNSKLNLKKVLPETSPS